MDLKNKRVDENKGEFKEVKKSKFEFTFVNENFDDDILNDHRNNSNSLLNSFDIRIKKDSVKVKETIKETVKVKETTNE